MPLSVVEVLRFCIVLFMGGLGSELSRIMPLSFRGLGLFDRVGVGTLLGVGAGYVLGGILGRLAGRSLRAAEDALIGRSAEQVLAGAVGAVMGVGVGIGLSWPLLLVGHALLTLPVVAFVCVTVGTLGYRVGVARRDAVLAVLGPRAGLGPTRVAAVALPRILDTSVAIDARVLDVVRAGFLHGTLVVPQPVIDELQGLADGADDTRRARGRRGLDTLDALRRERGIDLEVVRDEAPEVTEVDAKLLRMTLDRGAALLTLDANLAKAASIAGCRVMNLHALVLALRPTVTVGDTITVMLTRAGKEAGQGVGHLDDGTMVVVERARDRIGRETQGVVTSVLTSANGRMVFARRADVSGSPPSPSTSSAAEVPRPRPDAAAGSAMMAG